MTFKQGLSEKHCNFFPCISQFIKKKMSAIQIHNLKEMSDTNPHIFLGDTSCMPDNGLTAYIPYFLFIHFSFKKKSLSRSRKFKTCHHDPETLNLCHITPVAKIMGLFYIVSTRTKKHCHSIEP